MSKTKTVVIIILFFVFSISTTLSFFGYQFLQKGVSDQDTEIVFDVEPGQSMMTVAQNLHEKSLIKNPWLFYQYARIKGATRKLKRGEYALRPNMKPAEILAIVTSGKSIARNFTVAEGLNIFDIAELLEKAGYGTKADALQIMNDKVFIKGLLYEDLDSLEGYLFPETYKVTKFDTNKEIIAQMVKRFLIVWNDIQTQVNLFNHSYGLQAQAQPWTRNQIVTLASIVEKETGAHFERPLVASVFHNRLVKKMKLQTDPTVLYGMALNRGEMPKNISRSDLLTPTKHNTYTNYGLPPTPISNPGKEALLAVLQPAQTGYLYFVSKNDGTHVFSESLESHNAAVKNFQLNAKARDGKSWKDLKQ